MLVEGTDKDDPDDLLVERDKEDLEDEFDIPLDVEESIAKSTVVSFMSQILLAESDGKQPNIVGAKQLDALVSMVGNVPARGRHFEWRREHKIHVRCVGV